MESLVIRRACAPDAAAIAALHVRAWRRAYRGLLPEALLDQLDVGQRTAGWEQILGDPTSMSSTLVSELDGGIGGFCSVGPSRDDDAQSEVGEVWAIYVDPDLVRRGIGTQLFNQGLSLLRSSGFNQATLWVLDGNAPARRFYEKEGWSPDGARKSEQRGDYELREVRYRGSLVGPT